MAPRRALAFCFELPRRQNGRFSPYPDRTVADFPPKQRVKALIPECAVAALFSRPKRKPVSRAPRALTLNVDRP